MLPLLLWTLLLRLLPLPFLLLLSYALHNTPHEMVDSPRIFRTHHVKHHWQWLTDQLHQQSPRVPSQHLLLGLLLLGLLFVILEAVESTPSGTKQESLKRLHHCILEGRCCNTGGRGRGGGGGGGFSQRPVLRGEGTLQQG